MNLNSILNFLPPADGKKAYRLQCSLSLEEAAELEKVIINPSLPFNGDTTAIIRTFVRAGLDQLHMELNVESSAFLQSMKPVLGAELLKWSSNVCDSFAVACTDHLSLATESGDPKMGETVLHDVYETLGAVKHPSARAMIKKSLQKRGFVQACGALREVLLTDGENVYWLDNMVSEMFS